MIAFGGEFGQGGYAPGWITEWLDHRMNEGRIIQEMNASGLRMRLLWISLSSYVNSKIIGSFKHAVNEKGPRSIRALLVCSRHPISGTSLNLS